MNVGIICEGTTDFPVLSAVIAAVCPAPTLRIVPLSPDTDRLRSPASGPLASGWQSVRTFLQTSEAALAIGTNDLIVVHVDADILPKLSPPPEVLESDPPEGLDALCRHVKSWADDTLPANVVVVIPRTATEAWLLAAHQPKLKHVEEIDDPANELAERGFLVRAKDGSVLKRKEDYRKLARELPAMMRDERRIEELPELGRFIGKVFEVYRAVTRRHGA